MELFVKIFKALGEPTRLRILRLLAVRPMYVCELESVLGISQPRISQHLKVLKEATILREAKEAQKTFYMLNGDITERTLNDFLEFLRVDIGQLPEFKEESARLEKLENDSCIINCKTGQKSDSQPA
ncbi:MAG: metalloregulator ArsR/SmtB family transcription factor [Peptococcaceae bacterium]|nr:metalloregulator ArsR/SmtB family transcription factor [Peptococcaceae bacterium]